jgi:hypothetical protein
VQLVAYWEHEWQKELIKQLTQVPNKIPYPEAHAVQILASNEHTRQLDPQGAQVFEEVRP